MALERRTFLSGVLAALASLLALLFSAGLCGAQTEVTRASEPWLRIDARGDACLAVLDVRREIERLLEGRRPTRIAVRARAQGRGWSIELWHADGQYALRELPVLPDDCQQRLRALALATVLAVEHAIEAPQAAEEEPPARRARTTDWSLGLHAGASVGELPTPAPVLGAEARIERGLWVPVELLALFDVRPSSTSLAGARLDTRQMTGALGSCLGGSPRTWRIDACLGVELGAVFGYAASLPRATRDTAGSGAVNLAVAARWSPRPHLALTARVEGLIRFWVPRFQVLDAQGDLFAEQRLPVAGGRMRFGLSWLSR